MAKPNRKARKKKGVQPRQLPPHAGDSGDDCRVVADDAAREADQDRSEGRQPRPVRRVSDGGGRDPAQVVRRDRRENRYSSIAAGSDASVTTPAENMRRKPMGEVRPYDRAAKLLGATGADAGFTSRRTDGLDCREPGKTTETPGSGSKRTVIWGMSAKMSFRPIQSGECWPKTAAKTGPRAATCMCPRSSRPQ